MTVSNLENRNVLMYLETMIGQILLRHANMIKRLYMASTNIKYPLIACTQHRQIHLRNLIHGKISAIIIIRQAGVRSVAAKPLVGTGLLKAYLLYAAKQPKDLAQQDTM